MFEGLKKKETEGAINKETAKNKILQLVHELKNWYLENRLIIFSPYGMYSFDNKLKKAKQIFCTNRINR